MAFPGRAVAPFPSLRRLRRCLPADRLPRLPRRNPGSVEDRLVNPGPEDWKERYQYAALKYNRVVEDYNRLRKLYMNLVGQGGAASGLVTGAQFYKALRKDTRVEARKLDERYMKGGLRGSELRELERSRDEMRHRDWWLKKWRASSR